MPVPSVMNDLSITVSNNSPAGSESPISTDDFHRAIQAILRTTNAKASDIASAATTDIGAATAEFVDVTGTTTITGLGTIGAGIVRTVRFTGALTLTHNATSLILPGAANITTAANDRAVFRSLGSGNWLCVAYQKADGTAINISDSAVTNAKLAFDGGSLGYRNAIIGGDFTTNPWQRGTSFPAIAGGAYSADRWNFGLTGSTAVLTILKTADAPTAAQAGTYTQHCLHADITTAGTSIAAGDGVIIAQYIEGLNSASFGFGQAGSRFVTLSFWHKHTKIGVHCVSLRNSANDRSYVAEYTQDVTDTWERAEITIPVDTTGTWLYDTGIGLRVSFALMAGTTFQTTANTWSAGNFFATANQVNNLDNVANNFKIALVQLEAGSVATAFETRSVGQELSLCQRYWQNYSYYIRNDANAGGASFAGGYTHLVTMRATPTGLVNRGTEAGLASPPSLANITSSSLAIITSGTSSLTEHSAIGTVSLSAEL